MGLRVYVAGVYSRNIDGSQAGTIDTLKNIRAGQKACLDLWRDGFTPFCPWLDYQFMLLDDGEISVDMFKQYSMDWLEVSDAVVVLSGTGIGGGVDAEINRALALDIPLYVMVYNDYGQFLRLAPTFDSVNETDRWRAIRSLIAYANKLHW